jgi:fructose-1-phosphate kinase PfkB-like protein
LYSLQDKRQIAALALFEIQQLENKVFKNEKIITTLEVKDKKNNEIIELKDSKYKLVDEENKQLRDDIKKIKTKNVIIEIVGGSIIAALTYIITFK